MSIYLSYIILLRVVEVRRSEVISSDLLVKNNVLLESSLSLMYYGQIP